MINAEAILRPFFSQVALLLPGSYCGPFPFRSPDTSLDRQGDWNMDGLWENVLACKWASEIKALIMMLFTAFTSPLPLPPCSSLRSPGAPPIDVSGRVGGGLDGGRAESGGRTSGQFDSQLPTHFPQFNFPSNDKAIRSIKKLCQ